MSDGQLFAITLFTQDLEASCEFYKTFLSSEPVHREEDSTVFRIGGSLINLLAASSVDELIAPRTASPHGATALYTLKVDNVDASCERLSEMGIAPVTGPMNRPWGPRTANFADPSGHLWELSSTPT